MNGNGWRSENLIQTKLSERLYEIMTSCIGLRCRDLNVMVRSLKLVQVADRFLASFVIGV